MDVAIRLCLSLMLLAIFHRRFGCHACIFHILYQLLQTADKQFIHFPILHKPGVLLIHIFVRTSPEFWYNNIAVLIITFPLESATIYHAFINICYVVSQHEDGDGQKFKTSLDIDEDEAGCGDAVDEWDGVDGMAMGQVEESVVAGQDGGQDVDYFVGLQCLRLDVEIVPEGKIIVLQTNPHMAIVSILTLSGIHLTCENPHPQMTRIFAITLRIISLFLWMFSFTAPTIPDLEHVPQLTHILLLHQFIHHPHVVKIILFFPEDLQLAQGLVIGFADGFINSEKCFAISLTQCLSHTLRGFGAHLIIYQSFGVNFKFIFLYVGFMQWMGERELWAGGMKNECGFDEERVKRSEKKVLKITPTRNRTWVKTPGRSYATATPLGSIGIFHLSFNLHYVSPLVRHKNRTTRIFHKTLQKYLNRNFQESHITKINCNGVLNIQEKIAYYYYRINYQICQYLAIEKKQAVFNFTFNWLFGSGHDGKQKYQSGFLMRPADLNNEIMKNLMKVEKKHGKKNGNLSSQKNQMKVQWFSEMIRYFGQQFMQFFLFYNKFIMMMHTIEEILNEIRILPQEPSLIGLVEQIRGKKFDDDDGTNKCFIQVTSDEAPEKIYNQDLTQQDNQQMKIGVEMKIPEGKQILKLINGRSQDGEFPDDRRTEESTEALKIDQYPEVFSQTLLSFYKNNNYPKHILKHFIVKSSALRKKCFQNYPELHKKMESFVAKEKKMYNSIKNWNNNLEAMKKVFGKNDNSAESRLRSQLTRKVTHELLRTEIIPELKLNRQIKKLQKSYLFTSKVQLLRCRNSDLMCRVENH